MTQFSLNVMGLIKQKSHITISCIQKISFMRDVSPELG